MEKIMSIEEMVASVVATPEATVPAAAESEIGYSAPAESFEAFQFAADLATEAELFATAEGMVGVTAMFCVSAESVAIIAKAEAANEALIAAVSTIADAGDDATKLATESVVAALALVAANDVAIEAEIASEAAAEALTTAIAAVAAAGDDAVAVATESVTAAQVIVSAAEAATTEAAAALVIKTAALEAAVTIVTDAGDDETELATEAVVAAKALIATEAEEVAAKGDDAWHTKIWNWIKSTVETIKNAIIAFMKSAWGWITSLFKGEKGAEQKAKDADIAKLSAAQVSEAATPEKAKSLKSKLKGAFEKGDSYCDEIATTLARAIFDFVGLITKIFSKFKGKQAATPEEAAAVAPEKVAAALATAGGDAFGNKAAAGAESEDAAEAAEKAKQDKADKKKAKKEALKGAEALIADAGGDATKLATEAVVAAVALVAAETAEVAAMESAVALVAAAGDNAIALATEAVVAAQALISTEAGGGTTKLPTPLIATLQAPWVTTEKKSSATVKKLKVAGDQVQKLLTGFKQFMGSKIRAIATQAKNIVNSLQKMATAISKALKWIFGIVMAIGTFRVKQLVIQKVQVKVGDVAAKAAADKKAAKDAAAAKAAATA